jgi:hypothetical protein
MTNKSIEQFEEKVIGLRTEIKKFGKLIELNPLNKSNNNHTGTLSVNLIVLRDEIDRFILNYFSERLGL